MTACNSLFFGGADLLPPLDKEEEKRLLSVFVQEGDAQAKSSLIEHNLRLVIYIVKRFHNTGVGTEDLVSVGTIGLIKGINTFRPEKNTKLVTYVSRCIRNEILMYLRNSEKTKAEISIEELQLQENAGGADNAFFSNFETEEEYEMLRDAVSRLSLQDQEILRLRYGFNTAEGEEKTQREVSDLLGLSQSYISRLERQIIRQLRSEISLLNS